MTNPEVDLPAKPSMSKRAFVDFLLQQVVSTIGAMFIGLLLMVGIAALFALFTKNASGGNFVDHLIDQPFFRWADRSDAILIFSGFVLGAAASFWSRLRVAGFVWAIPAIVLVCNLVTWRGAGSLSSWAYWITVWDNYFGDCGNSECFYKIFVTVPFYCSVAYSLGWLCTTLFRQSAASTRTQS